MPLSESNLGYGSILKVGDGGVGAGTQASATSGTSNQIIRARAFTAGTAGNSKTFGILVSGNNTAFSYTISTASLVITSATDGSAAATTTVLQAIESIQNDPTYRDHWMLDKHTGNGSGVLVARATAALSGGTEGAEAFTAVAEVKNIGIASTTADIEVTHLGSPDATKEFIPGLTDAGELTFAINYLAANAGHLQLWNDQFARNVRNWRLVASNTAASTLSLRGYAKGLNLQIENEVPMQNSISIKLTAKPSWL